MAPDEQEIAGIKEISGESEGGSPSVVEKVMPPKIDIADKVKQAILKKKQRGLKSGAMQQKAIRSKQTNVPEVKARVGGIINKIEKTVSSLADTNNTMETLNKNMTQFINLIKRRSTTSGPGGGGFNNLNSESRIENPEGIKNKAGGGLDFSGLGDSENNQQNTSQFGGMLGNNALMSVLVGNMLKKNNDTDKALSEYNKSSPAYLNALTLKLQKYQKEYELLQYLFTKKKPMNNVPELAGTPAGNSAWLVGFLSMMNKS
jgi:hypothetical protein